MTVRRGEAERNWFRSERFERINGELYFQTREGSIEGPFESVHEAEMELLLYLRHVEDFLFRNVV